jgi:hypothetical protein
VFEQPGGLDPEADLRVAAASKLYLKPGVDAQETAIGLLADPLSEVRYHAIRALVSTREGRSRLCSLLGTEEPPDQQRIDRVLADLRGIGGPDSYYARRSAPVEYVTSGQIFADAVNLAAPARALPILAAARKAEKMPRAYLTLPGGQGNTILDTGWPDMCCICGRPSPGSASAISCRSEAVRHEVDKIITTRREVALSIPACPDHGLLQRVLGAKLDEAGVEISFWSPEFVADLVGRPNWKVRKGSEGWTIRKD